MNTFQALFQFINSEELFLKKGIDKESRAHQILRSLFEAISARQKTVPSEILKKFEMEVKKCAPYLELKNSNLGFSWVWKKTSRGELQDWVKHFRTAEDLLLNHGKERIKKCEGDNCPYLFFDESKNRSRRWCEMGDCGMLFKSRRYYERHRRKKS